MTKKITPFFIWFLQFAGICAVVLLAVCPVSCKVTDEGLQLLHGDYTAPVIESYSVSDAFSVSVLFSKKVQIKEAVIIPSAEKSLSEIDASGSAIVAPSLRTASESGNAIPVTITYDVTGKEITAVTGEILSVGAHYELYGEAVDETGNSLTFCIPFTGYNSRIPRLLITEIHPGYVSGSNRCEFIELYALTSGNVAGLNAYSANDGENRGFILPAAEVKAGDVIILHMRKKGENCINETGDSLSLSEGGEKTDYVSAKARDLWADNEKACIGDKEDVIIIKNSFSGQFIDAVMYAPSGTVSWTNDNVRIAAGEAAAAGVWKSGDPSSAIPSDGLTVTKTLTRRGCIALCTAVQSATIPSGPIAQSCSNWYVADSKTVSPGTVE